MSPALKVSAYALLCLLAQSVAAARAVVPDTVLFDGAVITLDGESRIVQALAVTDGVISALGSSDAMLALAGENTRRVDLDNRTVVPGFVDSHSHATFIGLQAMSANLLPAPDGDGNSVGVLQDILRRYLATDPRLLRDTGWLIGFGYDDSQLAGQRHPTRQDLDAVSTEHPILIVHQSGHLGVANSLGLQRAGIGSDTPDPEGGLFRREEGGRQPSGVAEEYAYFRLMFTAIGGGSESLYDEMLRAGAQMMARFGYTTAQEGRADPDTLATARRVAGTGGLSIDVVAYPDILTIDTVETTRQYQDRYRVGGVKLTIDGSPQGKTAWLSQPYHVPPDGQSADYRGYPAIDEETVMGSVLRAFEEDWQIQVHANGDAAIDSLIAAIAEARQQYPGKTLRPVLIHGQTLRMDQVASLDELDIFPSLFPMHTFYWGDWHRESVLGPVRAENISPTGWVRERDMIFGTHHDAPVALPDSMRVLSATVTRQTRSGRVLGPDQRVDVDTALRAMTLWPAWQHFEEDTKGSLEVGKLADIVVLSDNPLTVDPSELADLRVLATYKEGKAIYRAEESSEPGS